MEQNELVVFENFSILNQKAMSLPIGKVSIRQVLLITAGFMFATIFYLATTDLMYAVASFVPFVVIAMINTKIVSLDQIIKSNISFLIRGTSLSKKYLNHKKSKERDSKIISKKEDNSVTSVKEKKSTSLFSLDGIASLIDLILLKKSKKQEDEITSIEQDNINNKTKGNHSVVLNINHDENTITLSNLKTTIEKEKNKKTLFSNKKQKERIQDFLECTLDQTNLENSDYIIKKGNLTIPLHKSKKYSIAVNDEKIV